MDNFDKLKKLIIISGHYGCGKTNFSINLAVYYASKGEKVTLCDMDLVNPYFRTSDYRELIEEYGIEVVCPNYGASNLDLPSLPAAMYGLFDREGRVILDVGGDDVGATVLGRFHEKLKTKDFDMLYLVNFRRNLTSTPEEMAELLQEIELKARVKATSIVHNSHLQNYTTAELIRSEAGKAEKTADILNLPVIATTYPEDVVKEEELNGIKDIFPVKRFVKTVWE